MATRRNTMPTKVAASSGGRSRVNFTRLVRGLIWPRNKSNAHAHTCTFTSTDVHAYACAAGTGQFALRLTTVRVHSIRTRWAYRMCRAPGLGRWRLGQDYLNKK